MDLRKILPIKLTRNWNIVSSILDCFVRHSLILRILLPGQQFHVINGLNFWAIRYWIWSALRIYMSVFRVVILSG